MAAVVFLSLVCACRMPFGGRRLVWVIAAIVLILGAGVTLNVWYFTTYSHASAADPVLINVDYQRWWYSSLYVLGDDKGLAPYYVVGKYQYPLAAFMAIFGATIGSALILSMVLTIVALFICGLLTYKITSDSKIAVLAVVCTAAVCYWLAMGMALLKEPMLFVSFLCAAYAMTMNRWKFAWLMVVAYVLLLFTRPSVGILISLGTVLLAFRRGNRFFASLAAVAGVVITVATMTAYNIDSSALSDYVNYEPNQQAHFNLFGSYAGLPLYKKVLLLPLSAATQFLIPFTWTYARDLVFGPSQIWAHFGYPWYIFGFVFIYYLISCRKSYASTLYRLSVWALLCWLVPCLTFGGIISRYGLPFVALMAPAVAYTIMHNLRSKKFYVWLGAWFVVLNLGLIVVYHIYNANLQ